MDEPSFIRFGCTHCHTEIEATADMIGEAAECPACGAKLVVPDNRTDNVVRHAADDDRYDTSAMKSRTIRIELGDL